MVSSKNDYDWLGKGYYFWENNYERALDFANNPPGKTKIAKPSVLGAIIDLQSCLDLLDKDYVRLVLLFKIFDTLKKLIISDL